MSTWSGQSIVSSSRIFVVLILWRLLLHRLADLPRRFDFAGQVAGWAAAAEAAAGVAALVAVGAVVVVVAGWDRCCKWLGDCSLYFGMLDVLGVLSVLIIGANIGAVAGSCCVLGLLLYC